MKLKDRVQKKCRTLDLALGQGPGASWHKLGANHVDDFLDLHHHSILCENDSQSFSIDK
jgi:hypothetical protein